MKFTAQKKNCLSNKTQILAIALILAIASPTLVQAKTPDLTGNGRPRDRGNGASYKQSVVSTSAISFAANTIFQILAVASLLAMSIRISVSTKR